MKLHAMEFSGTLLKVAEHLNANALAEFDVVASRTTFQKASGIYITEVIFRVPDGFEEARWGANPPSESHGTYRAEMLRLAEIWRSGR